jgi:hypothetical protein
MQMKKWAVGTVSIVAAFSSASASAQDIVGSWKQTAFYQKVVSSGEKRFPFGEKIVGRSMYTREGTFCTMAGLEGMGLGPMSNIGGRFARAPFVQAHGSVRVGVVEQRGLIRPASARTG